MIDEKEILTALDEHIAIQNKNIERVMQVSNNQRELALLEREIATCHWAKKLIKEKSAHGAATPLGTLLNKQEQYNTDQKKSEIRKLAVEIFDLCLRLQEATDGTIEWIDWREPGIPCVHFEYYGSTGGLHVKIWKNGFDAKQRPDYSMVLFLDDTYCINEAKYLKNELIKLLEERRWNSDEE